MTDKILGQQIPAVNGHLSFVTREPLGVIGIILPWNGPLGAFVEKVSVAIACGNSVVVKPSEYSPLSALRLAELAVQSGMPRGLISVLVGGGDVGGLVANHAEIMGITFTGSVATGRRIAHAAADRFARTTLELGGKSANVVFADADLDAAVRGTTWGVFYNAGQVCCSGTRLLVHEDIQDVFVAELLARMSRVRVGDPLDESNHIGPVVSARQFAQITGLLERAEGDGATIVRSASNGSGRTPSGYYCDPTVVLDADTSSEVAQREIFGPVLTVIPFRTEQDALEIANGVEYGLAAKVWTRDLGRMLRMAHQLEAGSIWGNTAQVASPALPFGGFKASGSGTSSGQIAVDGVTRAKAVSLRYAEDAPTPGWDDIIDTNHDL
ncbi:acyl-CoA reductase-like NAD-dependent aldehyde dehydrogenase [Microbacterium ulmi]|nr:acyl-CoA reductase-like NAD-dependent aldehyde dehydrogenase [Microbacterium ulmi]